MENDLVAQERAELAVINKKPLKERLAYYTKKSGPGWLQAAITLGGGSLAGAMYLGSFMGYNMMWLQPLAMILGVIMLSAISYVTLTTGERPFGAIKQHVSPVLAWAWIIGTFMANVVWCMPQFSLGTAAIHQNLLNIPSSGISTFLVCAVLLGVAFTVNYFYESGHKGIALFELILKIMVGIVVLSFFAVVGVLTVKDALDWGAVFKGAIPNPMLLFQPAPTFEEHISQTGEFAQFWKDHIASNQLDVMMTAFGTAVGINMTFLLPYSMLRKKWGQEHRPLAIYDLSIGLIVPFVLATGCVVIAAASQFHAQYGDVLNEDGTVIPAMESAFNANLDKRLQAEDSGFAALSDDAKNQARAAAPEADRHLAAMLAKRNNFQLANALEPLAGENVSQKLFGVGVLGMALSTIIILMLINGFTVCEMLGKPDNRKVHLIGAAVAGIAGATGPYIWADAGPKLAIPTSVIGGSLIPIAYFTFLLLMNSGKTLGANRPTGKARMIWNGLMIAATSIATLGTIYVLKGKGTPGMLGILTLIVLFVIGVWGFLQNEKAHGAASSDSSSS